MPHQYNSLQMAILAQLPRVDPEGQGNYQTAQGLKLAIDAHPLVKQASPAEPAGTPRHPGEDRGLHPPPQLPRPHEGLDGLLCRPAREEALTTRTPLPPDGLCPSGGITPRRQASCLAS